MSPRFTLIYSTVLLDSTIIMKVHIYLLYSTFNLFHIVQARNIIPWYNTVKIKRRGFLKIICDEKLNKI